MTSTSVTSAGTASASGDHRDWAVPGAAVAAIGGPFVLALCNAIVNFTPGWATVASTADGIRAGIEHPVATEWIIATGIIAVLLIVPGIWAVAARLAHRTPKLAAVGGWMMATGYICALVLSTDTISGAIVAKSGLDPEAYGAAVDEVTLPAQMGLAMVFAIGALVGSIVLAIAMLRQRGAVPKWAGWLLLASAPVRMVGLILGVAVGPPLASLLIMAAFAAVVLGRKRRAE